MRPRQSTLQMPLRGLGGIFIEVMPAGRVVQNQYQSRRIVQEFEAHRGVR